MSVPMPSYFICRDTQPGQPIDPTAPLVFFPPKDSDELFDALRMKYPNLRTHSERMREAVIEFYREEQLVAQLPTPTTANSTMTSPWQASMQSMSSGSSTWSSPELVDLATPTFGNSPQPQAVPSGRQQSTATSTTMATDPTPPAIEHMTGVFSLSNAAQPKQRVRRKMTEAEKVEYRKRRIVKACDKCAKRKRKCNHNQPDMETVGTSKAQKVTKPSPTGASKKVPPIATPQIQEDNTVFGANPIDFGDSFCSAMSIPELDDYSTLFEDTLPDMSLDDLLMPTEQQWPYADWTLMDSSTEGLYDMNHTPPPNVTQQHYPGGSWFDQNVGADGDVFDQDMMQITGGGADKNILWEHLRTGQDEIPTEKQQPTHTPHVHEMDEKELFEYDADYAAPSFDWNQAGLQSNHNWPQHGIPNGAFNPSTGYAETGRAGLQFSDSRAKNAISVRNGSSAPLDSLAQMTLRLTGTAKAVKAFGNLLPSSSSRRERLQAVSLKRVALLALGGASVVQGLQRGAAGDLRSSLCTNASCATGKQFFLQKDLSRHIRVHHPRGDPMVDAQDQTMQNKRHASLHAIASGMTIEDYLRMHTNECPVQEDGRATQSTNAKMVDDHRSLDASSIASVSASALADVERDVKSIIQSKNPDSEYSSDTMPLRRATAAQQGRPIPSLGEGITTNTSPSTELYLLKRRIPKALHSVVDRNDPSAALGPLLMTIPENVDIYSQRDHEREVIISRNTECTEGNSILTEGGAYPTSDNVNNMPIFTGGSGAASSSAQPVHTRPRNPTASGFAGDTGDYHGTRHDGGVTVAVNVARLQPAEATFATGESYERTVKFSSTAANGIEVERLSDHVRHRDHFGRRSRSNLVAGLMFSLAAFATLITLSFVQTSPATLSLLLLALAAPAQVSDGSGGRGTVQSVSHTWLRPIRDIIENSSWHTGFPSLVQNHLPARVYMQRLMYRGKESDYWRWIHDRKFHGVVV